MSELDVADLTNDSLPEASFPANPISDFRLYMEPEVHQGTWAHAKEDTSVEICGVLVGRWERDENGPYAVVTNYIRCESAASKFAEVTFTHESWSQINEEMDSKYSDARIVGWYHSHPDFGIFLSDRDCFIHEHFFSNAGQVAFVVDPVRDLEGMFAWRSGKPTPLEHYWVGDHIEIGAVDSKSSASANVSTGAATSEAYSAGAAPPRSWLQELLMLLLVGLLFFMLGQFLAGQKSRWEREMIERGAVAHYGTNKIMKIGLEENLQLVSERLGELSKSLKELPAAGVELDEDAQQAANSLRRDLETNLVLCRDAIDRINRTYGLSDAERQTLLLIVAKKRAELEKAFKEPQKSSEKKKTEASSTSAETIPDKAKEQEKSAETPAAEKEPDAAAPSETTSTTSASE